MAKFLKGIITKRILKCISGIEKHSFRLERQQEELKIWLEQNDISVDEVSEEILRLVEEHDSKPLILKLQNFGLIFEENEEQIGG